MPVGGVHASADAFGRLLIGLARLPVLVPL
jgi:hypothetical protein